MFDIWCRGRGPLKSTMDVIGAAKKISEAGASLDKCSRQVAEQVSCFTMRLITSYHVAVT